MNGIPSSTYFTVAPDWGWLIVFYFFFGGLAGGCYFLGALIDLVRQSGGPPARPPRLLHRVSLCDPKRHIVDD